MIYYCRIMIYFQPFVYTIAIYFHLLSSTFNHIFTPYPSTVIHILYLLSSLIFYTTAIYLHPYLVSTLSIFFHLLSSIYLHHTHLPSSMFLYLLSSLIFFSRPCVCVASNPSVYTHTSPPKLTTQLDQNLCTSLLAGHYSTRCQVLSTVF